jgi:hypothetical protein
MEFGPIAVALRIYSRPYPPAEVRQLRSIMTGTDEDRQKSDRRIETLIGTL